MRDVKLHRAREAGSAVERENKFTAASSHRELRALRPDGARANGGLLSSAASKNKYQAVAERVIGDGAKM